MTDNTAKRNARLMGMAVNELVMSIQKISTPRLFLAHFLVQKIEHSIKIHINTIRFLAHI